MRKGGVGRPAHPCGTPLTGAGAQAMDFQNRVGSKVGSGGVASSSETNRARRERLRQLAMETNDLSQDPFFMQNHVGQYECKLCLTLHTNEGSYLAHTQVAPPLPPCRARRPPPARRRTGEEASGEPCAKEV